MTSAEADITVGTWVRMPPVPYTDRPRYHYGRRGQVINVDGCYARVEWSGQRGRTKKAWFQKVDLVVITRGGL